MNIYLDTGREKDVINVLHVAEIWWRKRRRRYGVFKSPIPTESVFRRLMNKIQGKKNAWKIVTMQEDFLGCPRPTKKHLSDSYVFVRLSNDKKDSFSFPTNKKAEEFYNHLTKDLDKKTKALSE